MRHFQVVAGILLDGRDQVLITERIGDGPFHGLWEFPGGKIDQGETAMEALHRELQEELGVATENAEHFMSLHHDYPDRSVTIDFFLVSAWAGEPKGIEGQELRWVRKDELDSSELLPADQPVIDALRTSLANT